MAKKLLVLLLEADILEGVLSWPIRELGAKVCFYRTDAHIKLYVEAHKPDVVLLDMPCGGPSMPTMETLAWLKRQCRSVRVVWDATDTPWHGYLEQYREQDAFDLVLAADGAVEWPHRPCDQSLPTPVDPKHYEGTYGSRTIRLGFSGSCGTLGVRKDILGNLQQDGTLAVRRREAAQMPYSHNAEFYKMCHAVLNVAATSVSQRPQCKARAIEACLAGCLLFETRGSPLSNWLTPNVHYTEYSTPEEVRAAVNHPTFTEQCKEIGMEASRRVRDLDLPQRFWSTVMGN